MAKKKDGIRVLVADDHALFREGLCRLLGSEDDLTVVGEACSGEECLKLSAELKPDVLVLDLKMPEHDGLEVLDRLGGKESATRTIVVTASEDERDFVEAVQRGARGVVLKQAESDILLEGIRKVHRGEVWIDQRVAAGVMEAMSRPAGTPAGRRALLTERELEIVTLIAQGLRNKEIAGNLSISEQTVKNHLHSIFDKLGVSDRLELALYALHHRLVDNP